MRRIHRLAVVAALAAAPAAAQTLEVPAPAEAPPRPARLVKAFFEAVGEFGGETVATVGFEDGSTQDVNTGQGLTVSGGAIVRPSAGSPLALRGSVGFKFVGTKADNANIFLTRIPVEIVASYDLPSDLWVGAGYTRHTFTKFHGDEFGPDLAFEDGNGATVEFGWRWIGVSYTSMRYTDEHGAEYNASVFGFVLTSAFGR
ncbi:MAG TPA: hypothetical protein VFQ45_06520 [Longimicrobium sp.]|nr:hypothetical protein [Longimicrobium sp.]